MNATITFHRYYVTDGTTRARVNYSRHKKADGRPCVTLYAQDYSDALAIVASAGGFRDAYRNDTDSQTDYFDKGHVDFSEDSPYYAAAVARAIANEAANELHWQKVQAKRAERRARALAGR